MLLGLARAFAPPTMGASHSGFLASIKSRTRSARRTHAPLGFTVEAVDLVRGAGSGIRLTATCWGHITSAQAAPRGVRSGSRQKRFG